MKCLANIFTKFSPSENNHVYSILFCIFAVSLGIKHPDPVVETSSLASVEPPDIWYNLSIPETIIDQGELSALQLEAITYASQRHEVILPSGERGGFLIGMLVVCHTKQCSNTQTIPFLARLHFSAEELMLYPQRQRPRWGQRPRRRPHAKC